MRGRVKLEPKFAECPECRFFFRRRKPCGDCGAGEFFEETTEELDPDLDELMSDKKEFDDDGE